MNRQQLENKLREMVGQYNDPDELFAHAIEEHLHMFQLRGNPDSLIRYMLEAGYAPNNESAKELAKEFQTPEKVISVLSSHLKLMAGFGKIHLNLELNKH